MSRTHKRAPMWPPKLTPAQTAVCYSWAAALVMRGVYYTVADFYQAQGMAEGAARDRASKVAWEAAEPYQKVADGLFATLT